MSRPAAAGNAGRLDVIYELQGRHETQGKHIHDEATIRELRKSPEFAAEYLRAALEDADESRVLLIALARVGRTLLSDVEAAQ